MAAIRPIKSLGQVFLTHSKTADAIVEALEIEAGEIVLEIGPGKGILTRRLVDKGCSVIGVEIDPRLVSLLKMTIGAAPNLTLVNDDFLQFDMRRFSGIKIVGNLPYYLSTEILLKLLEHSSAWERAVLTTQREFAERVLGKPGTKHYCALSVICSYLCLGRRLFNIPPRFFKPSPGVMSTTFVLTRRSPPISLLDDKWFYQVVQAAFSPQRRKTVLNNICVNLNLKKETAIKIFSQINLDQKLRAEKLSLEQFGLLSEALRTVCK
ncbi:ribosomal RNA small subunit methyltransferase A [candidate division WOR-3 bacterium]|nr:ribosomal RNA small subunit methyltransferase A [candidate division WOR-3 bacterium]